MLSGIGRETWNRILSLVHARILLVCPQPDNPKRRLHEVLERIRSWHCDLRTRSDEQCGEACYEPSEMLPVFGVLRCSNALGNRVDSRPETKAAEDRRTPGRCRAHASPI